MTNVEEIVSWFAVKTGRLVYKVCYLISGFGSNLHNFYQNHIRRDLLSEIKANVLSSSHFFITCNSIRKKDRHD